jgi:hypothetical protein
MGGRVGGAHGYGRIEKKLLKKKLKATGTHVMLSVTTLKLVDNSVLYDKKFDDKQVFIQWEFLDFDEDECQTDLSLYLPRAAGETVDFQMYKSGWIKITKIFIFLNLW